MKIKKGDLVQVITGKDKGKQGKVVQAYPGEDRVLVEGVNRVKKHTKAGQTARGSQTGGIVTTEAPIHVSNVSLVVEKDGKRSSRASGTASTTTATRSALPSGPVRTSDDCHHRYGAAPQAALPRGHRRQAA
jgi:large subunit ribosomal protein L24